jgi:hypothetical protein
LAQQAAFINAGEFNPELPSVTTTLNAAAVPFLQKLSNLMRLRQFLPELAESRILRTGIFKKDQNLLAFLENG